ncbi:arsenite-transporting ATPase [Saccharomonospora amisosensis]|uniref:Arsenite-transporting ATPase n=1 Tax=Saccharomonospora amisosensis TaxID=1128677 RepID=A0A7X5ZRU2_9PSEU|nr:TRC40/GET3/ArsA family transport-energizing ATPase [Saccharomonospora amisosensis]NIJ13239.1 arsenite-transporting ATPase [Saccharomonospora amisosensis]
MLLIRFFGGKGGVGKTTMAAAYALSQARKGHRTLVVSTDPAHSLGDALATPVSDEPTEVAAGLWAAEISGERQAQRRVAEIAEDARHAVPLEVLPAVERHLARAAEAPGTLESALLDRLTELVEGLGDRWDRVVVDSAPTGHMLRLLSLPELLTPWIEGLARQREKAGRIDRLVAGMLAETRDEPDPLLERLHARRARMEWMRERLAADARVHLVLVPEYLPLAETLRAADTLVEGGMRLAAVIVNRVLPAEETGVLARRRGQQQEVLARVRERFDGAGVIEVPLLAGALTGLGELETLADLLDRAGMDS